MNNRQKGNWGEDVAVKYLLQNHYEILERNYRVGRGEIDIIAARSKIVVFVEVKSGMSRKFGAMERRVTPSKQRQLKRIARCYLAYKLPEDIVDVRFDVVVVDGNQSRYSIRHYEAAFYLL